MQEALKREKKARRTLGLVFPRRSRRALSERNGRLLLAMSACADKVLAHLMFGMTGAASSPPIFRPSFIITARTS